MGEYVICASCGARMRADRRWCLKCDEPLVAATTEPVVSPLAGGRAVIAGAIVSLAVLIVFALVWERPRTVAAVTRPFAATAPRSSVAAAPTPDRMGAPQPMTPVTSMDSQRLGAVAFAGKDFDRAVVDFQRAVDKSPDDPEALNSLGQVLVRLHRQDEAIEKFTRAAALAPEKWSYHFNLAHAFGEQAKWDAAIGEYRIAARLFPSDYATQYNLAMALHKNEDDAAAVPELEKAIQLAPGEPTFHLSLAIVLEKLGRRADARAEYGRYVDMSPDAPDAAQVRARIEQLSR